MKEIQRKEEKIAIVVSIVIIILLVAIIGVLLYKNKDNNDEEETKRNVVVNTDNIDEVLSNLSDDEKKSSGTYQATMNSTWNFENGTSASDNAYVENVVTNTNDVYFDVNLKNTDELIYSSPVLPLGSHLEKIVLDKSLEAGSYDCILTYHLVNDNQKTLSTLKIALTIVIRN